MKKLSRSIYQENIADADSRKALALLIYVKTKFRSSVIKDFSYNRLARIANIHPVTAKRILSTLNDMELIDYVNGNSKNVLLKTTRAPHSNINIEKIDTSSVKSIERGLQALYIVEIQNRKNWVNHQINQGTNPKPYQKKNKRAERFCKQNGLQRFNDKGISYKTLSKRMNVSKSTVSKAIKYGETNGMLTKTKHFHVIATFKTKREAVIHCLDSYKFNGRLRVFDNKLCLVACNTYSIKI